jgi:hypothetical protein
MRYGWVAEYVNRLENQQLVYELYRPLKQYHAVVFLKSMSSESASLARNLSKRGVKTVFDLNVDYLTPASGKFYYEEMAPSEEQRLRTAEMCRICDGVFCASAHITSVATSYNDQVLWLPDNIRDDLIAKTNDWQPRLGEKIPLLWSGQAVKLFELLRIKDVLLEFCDRVHLRLITNSLSALDKWPRPLYREFMTFLGRMPHDIIPFSTVESLLEIYSQGGVCISPRHLDNSYNRGHSEWKITLALAKGCLTLASEQQSYVTVQQRAGGRGVVICRTDDDWHDALERVCSGGFAWQSNADAALKVVREYYATSVVARHHADAMRSILAGRPRPG